MKKITQAQAQRALFNKEFAAITSAELAAWQRSYLQRIEKYLLPKAKKHARIVELGCGDGRLTISLAEKGYQLTACDISDTSVAIVKRFAKQKKVRVNVVQCDVTKLPFPAKSFDFVIAGAILEHLSDEQTALREWSRVLKKGGRAMIVTPLRQRHVLPIWWVLNWFHDRRLGHVRRYDAKRYRAFSRVGLELKMVRYTGHTPKVLLTILHILFPAKWLEELAEQADVWLEGIEYDGNNIIGFFEKR